MRWIKLNEDADDQIQQLSPQTREVLEAHCRGINDALSDSRTPIEFKLTGYKPDPWTLEWFEEHALETYWARLFGP